jgi:hypothetical protein
VGRRRWLRGGSAETHPSPAEDIDAIHATTLNLSAPVRAAHAQVRSMVRGSIRRSAAAMAMATLAAAPYFEGVVHCSCMELCEGMIAPVRRLGGDAT